MIDINMILYGFVVLCIASIINHSMSPKTYPPRTILQPPSYVFAYVWTTIYVLYGIYLYFILTYKETYLNWIVFLWGVNFVLNLSWTPCVFRYRKYQIGVYIIICMIFTLLAMIVSTTNIISKNLLIPYLSWLFLALMLNIELVRNKTKKVHFNMNRNKVLKY